MSLAVAFAISAIAVAAASAERPEFGRCLKVTTKSLSNFDNSKCVKLAGDDAGTEAENLKKGNYEWTGTIVKEHFTTNIKEGTSQLLESIGGTRIICQGETGGGEYTGSKTVGSVVMKFTGCEASGAKCNSAGEGEGDVTTDELSGLLGIWKTGGTTAEDKPAISLRPTVGETVMQFSCSGLAVSIKGAVLGQASGGMKLHSMLKFVMANGEQKPEGFVEGPMETLECAFGFSPEQCGLRLALSQTNEERVEINTVA